MTPSPDIATPFDGRGCLTATGLATFQRAPPGRAPKEVAAHVAACARCQERLLAVLRAPGTAASTRGRRGPEARSPWRGMLVALGSLLFLLLLSLAGLAAVRWLAAR